MCIRPTSIEDSEEISNLIISSVIPWKNVDFDDPGWARFCESSNIQNTQNRMCDSQHFSLCKTKNGKIAGVITIKNWEKLDQLYILPKYHKQGIASSLWETARRTCRDSGYGAIFSVRSSTYAVPVYQKFGFQKCGPRNANNGSAFTPMKFVCTES